MVRARHPRRDYFARAPFRSNRFFPDRLHCCTLVLGAGDAPSITFSVGDVVGEKALQELAWQCQEVRASQLANGGEAIQQLVTVNEVSYLYLDEADRVLVPERMVWVAANLITFKIIKTIEVFRSLTGDQIEQLVQCGTTVSAEPGERVSSSSLTAADGPDTPRSRLDLGSHLCLIISGRVRVNRRSKVDAAKVEQLGMLGVAEHFGAKNIVDPDAPREVNIEADTPLQLLALDAASFGKLLPLVQHSLARELANRRWILENRNKVAVADLRAVRTIGLGTFGRVKLVIHTPTGRPYALKCLKKRMLLRLNQVANVSSEHALLSTCNHPFLLKLAAAFQDTESLYMVLEFVQGGEVYRLLYDGPLEVEHARYYAASVVAAFSYLSSLNVVYRDLKPENLLLASSGQLRLVDFGFAKTLPEGKAFTFCGTPDYMAPEMICHRGYSLAVDWWSLGVLIWELLTCEMPFLPYDGEDVDTFGKVIAFATGKARLTFPPAFDRVAKDLVTHLLLPDPVDRCARTPLQRRNHARGRALTTCRSEHITLALSLQMVPRRRWRTPSSLATTSWSSKKARFCRRTSPRCGTQPTTRTSTNSTKSTATRARQMTSIQCRIPPRLAPSSSSVKRTNLPRGSRLQMTVSRLMAISTHQRRSSSTSPKAVLASSCDTGYLLL